VSGAEIYDVAFQGWLALSLVVFVLLHVITAPYGRLRRPGWGPTIPTWLAWQLMEVPAVCTICVFWALAGFPQDAGGLVLLGMWQLHYLHRTFVYPLRARTAGRRTPLLIALMGGVTNVGVGYLVGGWLFGLGPALDAGWLTDPRFVVGAALFAGGMTLNIRSDNTLLALRKDGDTGYHIPRGGGYRWVSCPNYLGEIVEWTGFALASWSPGGLAFAVWTTANLVPRAKASHRWYQEQFDDYPAKRRALVPFVF
jgi:protein-S-isoprenylcysteine O-methyltransferase Ste14